LQESIDLFKYKADIKNIQLQNNLVAVGRLEADNLKLIDEEDDIPLVRTDGIRLT
jgi:hypothetical protein